MVNLLGCHDPPEIRRRPWGSLQHAPPPVSADSFRVSSATSLSVQRPMASGYELHKLGTCKEEINGGLGRGNSFSHLPLHDSFSSLKTKASEEVGITDRVPGESVTGKLCCYSALIQSPGVPMAPKSRLFCGPCRPGMLGSKFQARQEVEGDTPQAPLSSGPTHLQRALEICGSSPHKTTNRQTSQMILGGFRILVLILTPDMSED